jgi:GT2 family glycosyltransferase
MDSNLLKIEIVIPVYNRRETTLQGLRSLSRINKNRFDVQIVIVDDGSTDGTGEAIRKNFPEIKVIEGDGTLHYAAGTNRGISDALTRNPDFILTANDDAVFHPEFLQRLIKTAQKNPHSIIGGLLLLWDEPHKVFQVAQEWKTLEGGWIIPEDLTAFNVPQTAFEVECIVGNCVLFPVEAIRENGLMDEERFPHGWGDAEYLMRMKKNGWNLMVEPKAFIWCEPNTYPKPLHQLGLKEIFDVLFFNYKHPLNLRRQFIARWETAPTKFQGFLSYLVYLGMLSFKSLKFAFKK